MKLVFLSLFFSFSLGQLWAISFELSADIGITSGNGSLGVLPGADIPTTLEVSEYPFLVEGVFNLPILNQYDSLWSTQSSLMYSLKLTPNTIANIGPSVFLNQKGFAYGLRLIPFSTNGVSKIGIQVLPIGVYFKDNYFFFTLEIIRVTVRL